MMCVLFSIFVTIAQQTLQNISKSPQKKNIDESTKDNNVTYSW